MKEINALKNLQLNILGGKKHAGSGVSGLLFGSVLHRTLNLFSLKTVNNRIILNRLKTSAKTTDLPVIKIVVKGGQPKENTVQTATALTHSTGPEQASSRISPKTSPVQMKSIKEIINVDRPADHKMQRKLNTDKLQPNDHTKGAEKAQVHGKTQIHPPLASVQKEITPQEHTTLTNSNLPEQSLNKKNGEQLTSGASKTSAKEKIHQQPHHAGSAGLADPKAGIKQTEQKIKPIEQQHSAVKPESKSQPINIDQTAHKIPIKSNQETTPAGQNKVPPAPQTINPAKQAPNRNAFPGGRNNAENDTKPAEYIRMKTKVNQQPPPEISKSGIETKPNQAGIKHRPRQSSAEIPALKNDLKSTPQVDLQRSLNIKNEAGLKTVQPNFHSAARQEKSAATENSLIRISHKSKSEPESPVKEIKNDTATPQQKKTSQPYTQSAKALKLNLRQHQSAEETLTKRPEVVIKHSASDKNSIEPLSKTPKPMQNEAVLSKKDGGVKVEHKSAQQRQATGMNEVKNPERTGSAKETIIHVEKHVKQIKTETVVKDKNMPVVKSETPMNRVSEKAVKTNTAGKQTTENSVDVNSAIDKGQRVRVAERPNQYSASEKTTIKATPKPDQEMKSIPGNKEPESAIKQLHAREVRSGASGLSDKVDRQVSQNMSRNTRTEGAADSKQTTDSIKEKSPQNRNIIGDKIPVSEYKNSGTDQEKIAEDKTFVREDEKSVRRTPNDNKNSIGSEKNVRQNPGDIEKKVSTTLKIDSDPKPDNTRSGISTLNPDEKQVKMNSDPSRNQNQPVNKVSSTQLATKTHAETEHQFNGQFSRHESESREFTASDKRDTQAGSILRNGQTVENTGKAANDMLPTRFTQIVDQIREAYQLKQHGRVLTQEKTTFRIERGPLGKMDINFQNEKGASKVTIVVESEIAKTELLKYVPIIQQNLQEKGVDITSLFINVNNFNDKEQQDKEFQSKTMHSEQNTGKEDYEENIAHPGSNRNYGYNTMEVIA